MFARGFAPHGREHAAIDVLQRHVDVPHHVPAPRDGFDQFVAPVRRVGVKQAHPEIARDLVEAFDESTERDSPPAIHRLARAGLRLPPIHAEVGGVLTDEVELPNPLRYQVPHLGFDGRDRPAPVPAAHLRDDAETAGVIATFGDLDVSVVRRRQPKTRRVPLRHVARLRRDQIQGRGPPLPATPQEAFDHLAGLRHLVQAEESVDLRQFRGKLFGKPLGHAAAHDQFLPRVLRQTPPLVRFQDGFDRFLFRRVDERARVDDEDVGIGRVGGDGHPAGANAAQHDLGVHQVLGAPQADHTDLGRLALTDLGTPLCREANVHLEAVSLSQRWPSCL